MTEREWLDIFSDNLRELLQDVNMSQKELAHLADLAESSVSGYLKGTKMPGVRALINIAYALDCDMNELIDFGETII